MDVAITKMSSKGQIVIPAEMRKDLEEGETLVIMKNKNQIIMKKASEFSKTLEEDLEFAKRTEEAFLNIEAGKGIKMDFDDFIKEMKKW